MPRFGLFVLLVVLVFVVVLVTILVVFVELVVVDVVIQARVRKKGTRPWQDSVAGENGNMIRDCHETGPTAGLAFSRLGGG